MEEFPEGYFDPLPILIPEVIDVKDDPEPELTEEEKEVQKKEKKHSVVKSLLFLPWDYIRSQM